MVAGGGCKKSPAPLEPGAAPPAPAERIAVPGARKSALPTTPPVAVAAPSDTVALVAAGADPSYNVDIAPMTATAGAEASSTITVHPGKGYKVNLEYPVKLTLDAVADVSFAKSVMEKPDASTFDLKSLVFAAKATAAKPGTYSLKGTLKFAVCTESTCDPKKVPVVIALNAK
jgi:hypothetical protein